MLHNLSSMNFLSHLNSIQHPAIFFLEFLILGMMYTQLAGDVTWRESLPSPIYFLILISRLAIRKAAKRGHCTRAEQEWCIMTE